MSHKVVYDEKINGLLYLTGLTRTYFGQTLGLIRMRFSVNNFLSVCQQVPSMAHRTRGEDRATHGATSVTFLPSAFSHFTVVQSPLGLSAPSPCLDSTPHEPFLWRCLLWWSWGGARGRDGAAYVSTDCSPVSISFTTNSCPGRGGHCLLSSSVTRHLVKL